MLAVLNQTFTISNSSGVFCEMSVDGIGTCWPRSAAGELISRPCPEQFNGIHYNTTSKSVCLSLSRPVCWLSEAHSVFVCLKLLAVWSSSFSPDGV